MNDKEKSDSTSLGKEIQVGSDIAQVSIKDKVRIIVYKSLFHHQ